MPQTANPHPTRTELAETTCDVEIRTELADTTCEVENQLELAETTCDVENQLELAETTCEVEILIGITHFYFIFFYTWQISSYVK